MGFSEKNFQTQINHLLRSFLYPLIKMSCFLNCICTSSRFMYQLATIQCIHLHLSQTGQLEYPNGNLSSCLLILQTRSTMLFIPSQESRQHRKPNPQDTLVSCRQRMEDEHLSCLLEREREKLCSIFFFNRLPSLERASSKREDKEKIAKILRNYKTRQQIEDGNSQKVGGRSCREGRDG